MEFIKNSSKRDVHNNECLPQQRYISNNLSLQLREQGEKKMKPKIVEGRKWQKFEQKGMEETKMKIRNINETKSWFFEQKILAKIYLDSWGERQSILSETKEETLQQITQK